MLNSSWMECLYTVASRWWRPSLWLVILLNIQISQPSFAAGSRRGAKSQATWKYNQCPPAASFIFHNFLQSFEWHPCNILCAVCGVCKQGDYPKKNIHCAKLTLMASAPYSSKIGLLRSRMEDRLQCGSPTYPIALYWRQAQQSTVQKILSAQKFGHKLVSLIIQVQESWGEDSPVSITYHTSPTIPPLCSFHKAEGCWSNLRSAPWLCDALYSDTTVKKKSSTKALCTQTYVSTWGAAIRLDSSFAMSDCKLADVETRRLSDRCKQGLLVWHWNLRHTRVRMQWYDNSVQEVLQLD